MEKTTTDRGIAEELLKIREMGEALRDALEALVDDRPTYWHGTPDGYDFPMSADQFQWLYGSLNALISALADEEDDGGWGE